MMAKAFGSIETLSPEISASMRLVPLGEGDFSTPLRFGRNDNVSRSSILDPGPGPDPDPGRAVRRPSH